MYVYASSRPAVIAPNQHTIDATASIFTWPVVTPAVVVTCAPFDPPRATPNDDTLSESGEWEASRNTRRLIGFTSATAIAISVSLR